jgi:hypothetical protein
MSLALLFSGNMLCSNGTAHSAVVTLEDGSKIPVRFHRSAVVRPTLRSGPFRPGFQGYFAVSLDSLPNTPQQWVRKTANEIQKRKHDNAPTHVYPRRGGLLPTRNHRGQTVNSRGRVVRRTPPEPIPVEKPPKTKQLPNDYLVKIDRTSTYNGRTSLEVGKRLTISYSDGLISRSLDLGIIKEFVLIK